MTLFGRRLNSQALSLVAVCATLGDVGLALGHLAAVFAEYEFLD
jgi:hypothetical protein